MKLFTSFLLGSFFFTQPSFSGEPDWTKPDHVYHVNLDSPREGTVLSLEGPNAQLVFERLPGPAVALGGALIKRSPGVDCRKDEDRYGCSLVILKNGKIESLSAILGNGFPEKD